MKFFIIVGIISSVFSALPQECFTTLVQSQSCLWYARCLEAKYQCGKDGYPMGYGFKYCGRFGQLKTFPAARQWIQKTTICLKKNLLPVIQDEVTLNCQKLKKQAYNTHPKCYYQAGFCKLPEQLGFQDSAIFLKQLLGVFDLKDFQSLSAAKQIEQMVKDCWKFIQQAK